MKSLPNNDPPKPFSLDQINVPNSQADEPHTYFAGKASLNVDWICYPQITKIANSSPPGGKKDGGGKVTSGGSSTQVFHGNVAGILCQGQIDFIWGVMLNNDLVYPPAYAWDSKKHSPGQHVLFTVLGVLGCYNQAGADDTRVDPPNAPWALIAVAYNNATAYVNNDKVLGADNSLWNRVGGPSTGVAPQATKPTPVQFGQTNSGNHNAISIPHPTISGWQYVGSPQGITANSLHHANAIVSYRGKIYTTPSQTNAEPPAAPWVLWKIDRASSPNPLKFTIPKYGDCYLYWGTDTQTLDTVNEAFLNSQGHPAYRSRAVLVLKKFLFGQGTTTPPSIKVLAGRNPVQDLIVGPDDRALETIPWAVTAELLK